MPNAAQLLKEVNERAEAIQQAKEKLAFIRTGKSEIETALKEETVSINEPPEFEACVRNGGRVRTKDLGGGKFMRICFINGKSHAGEVQTKKEDECINFDDPESYDLLTGKDIMPLTFNQFKLDKGEAMDLSLNCKILESKIDEKKNTVLAGVLQEDTLSANGRFYPAHVVREAIIKLPGKRSLIGHETDNVEDIVAKITRSEMRNGVGFAEFKFGTDEKSKLIFSKIKDGLVDSTSIRASGTTKHGKINGEMVDVVETLDIFSVDWVVEGGVAAAKVAKVFESKPEIVFEQTKKENEMEIKELEAKLAEEQKKNKELEEGKAKAEKAAEDSKRQAEAAKLNEYKLRKLDLVRDQELKDYVAGHVHGNSEAEIDKSIQKEIAFFEKFVLKNKIKEDIILKPSDGKLTELKAKNVNQLLESDQLTEKDRVEVLVSLMS